jgi:hypothetical protein
MTMRDALERAMGHSPDEGTVQQLQQGGLAVVSEDTVSQAIHDVYCGIVADHQDPSDKDREQARALIASLNKQLAETVAAGG